MLATTDSPVLFTPGLLRVPVLDQLLRLLWITRYVTRYHSSVASFDILFPELMSFRYCSTISTSTSPSPRLSFTIPTSTKLSSSMYFPPHSFHHVLPLLFPRSPPCKIADDHFCRTEVWPIVREVSNFFADFVELEDDGLYHMYNVTSPDEYAEFVNDTAFSTFPHPRLLQLLTDLTANGALTVILRTAIDLAARVNVTPPANWSTIAENMFIKVDNRSGITVQFDGFNGSAEVKQADVVLLTYPFAEFEQPASRALLNLDYYAGKTATAGQSSSTLPPFCAHVLYVVIGPAMTFSIHSIGESALSVAGCAAYTFFLAASQPYSRAPFYQ